MKTLFQSLKEVVGGHQQSSMSFLTDDDLVVDIVEMGDDFDGINVGTLSDMDVGLTGYDLFYVNKTGVVEYLKDYKMFAQDEDVVNALRETEDVIVDYVMNNQDQIAASGLTGGLIGLAAAKTAKASSSRHCSFYKAKDGNWYMELAPNEYGEYEDADTYGPFGSEEAAEKFLDDGFSNPGGWDSDSSGRREVPTKSPNGSPVEKPGRSSSRWSLASSDLLGFNMKSKNENGREIDIYDLECDYHIFDGTQAAKVILDDLSHNDKVGKMLMDLSNSDKIILNGVDVDMEQLLNEISVASSDCDHSINNKGVCEYCGMSEHDCEEDESLSVGGYVSINVKPGDKVKCINAKKYRRQYGTGPDWTVPAEVKEGEIYEVDSIAKDYFGANKLVLIVDGKKKIVDSLYMDGMDYKPRFELVGQPDKEISRVI
jgi:hypothetical protein